MCQKEDYSLIELFFFQLIDVEGSNESSDVSGCQRKGMISNRKQQKIF